MLVGRTRLFLSSFLIHICVCIYIYISFFRARIRTCRCFSLTQLVSPIGCVYRRPSFSGDADVDLWPEMIARISPIANCSHRRIWTGEFGRTTLKLVTNRRFPRWTSRSRKLRLLFSRVLCVLRFPRSFFFFFILIVLFSFREWPNRADFVSSPLKFIFPENLRFGKTILRQFSFSFHRAMEKRNGRFQRFELSNNTRTGKDGLIFNS